nr:hypothetical protein [Kibdelosporangium sp. MJ126-NF4]
MISPRWSSSGLVVRVHSSRQPESGVRTKGEPSLAATG